MKLRQLFCSLFILLSISTFSQSAKKYFSSGEKFQEAKNYKEAIDNYSKALEMDPNYEKAYIARATCYELMSEKAKAAEDYKRAIAFSPKDKELYYNCGRLLFDIEKYTDADAMLKMAIERDKSYAEAVELRIKTLLKLHNFKEGLAVTEQGLDIKKTSINFYYHAVMLDSLKNYVEAEKEYKESKYYDSKNIPAYVGLATVQAKLNKLDEALAICETAFTKSPNDKSVHLTRSRIYAQKGDYTNALADLSKVIVLDPENMDIFMMRGTYYEKSAQYQNAISDYTKVITNNAKHQQAYYRRAFCFEQLTNYKAAINDYEQIITTSTNKEQAQSLLKDVKQKLYELNRETVSPTVALSDPISDGRNLVKLPGDKEEFILKGRVSDASQLKAISVNNIGADFSKDSLNPHFAIKVNLNKQNEFTVTATDIYDNTTHAKYTVERTEINKPSFALVAPATSFDNEVYLDNSNPELYLEGKVKDESLIKSIIIDGVTASYPLDQFNPTFSTKISIANRDKFTIAVRDIYGNETSQEYKITRDLAKINKTNPMGVTWVIFMENSTYQNFASLEGPTKDVVMMKQALTNYSINKYIHKKNMTKADMEKFFSIELRDLVRANNVNSILLWYAGHGKFVNQTGYWIPVDAKIDDEFTYFNINNLKASMQSYNKVVHTLVITDACESGPSFYLAMRDTPKEKRCEDWESTEFKSAQVLSSAGYELASDNSQFTKTFAQALSYNPDGCISIDKIAQKVAASMKQSSSTQAPKLGKISGLEDEDGTFFFIKK